MAIKIEGNDVFLTGDWNISGMVGNIDRLANILQEVDERGDKTLKIDCGQIKSVDFDGLQILKVWLQCARFRGLEPRLVNLSEGLQRIMLVTGFAPADAGLCPSLS